jgi:hypothetical protein
MDKLIRNSTAEFLIFTSQGNDDSIEVKVYDESVWLTQNMIAQLFDKGRSTITEHLKNIFDTDELDEKAVCRNFRHTANDGKNYNTKYYNLDAIISIGYRVNSKKATQFRKWATSVLKEFAIKGFVLDKKRLENGSFLGENYFDKLLEEIREIRLSERMFYQKLTDIYATSMDYNKHDKTTKKFFAKVQNKLHFAIHGNTAAELIYTRANNTKENMGLTSWNNAPDGKILRTDVTIAKNYLAKDELEHKYKLELALLDEEYVEELGDGHVPEGFSISEFLVEKNKINESSTLQEIYAYAISSEKKAIQFYANLMNSCKGSQMEYLFEKLRDEEKKHLDKLEKEYEETFMQEN